MCKQVRSLAANLCIVSYDIYKLNIVFFKVILLCSVSTVHLVGSWVPWQKNLTCHPLMCSKNYQEYFCCWRWHLHWISSWRWWWWQCLWQWAWTSMEGLFKYLKHFLLSAIFNQFIHMYRNFLIPWVILWFICM